jgi:hypothetical protein
MARGARNGSVAAEAAHGSDSPDVTISYSV